MNSLITKNLQAYGRVVGMYHTLRLSLVFCYQIAPDALKFHNNLLAFNEVVEQLGNPIDISIKQIYHTVVGMILGMTAPLLGTKFKQLTWTNCRQ